jgi:hypothetical protein
VIIVAKSHYDPLKGSSGDILRSLNQASAVANLSRSLQPMITALDQTRAVANFSCSLQPAINLSGFVEQFQPAIDASELMRSLRPVITAAELAPGVQQIGDTTKLVKSFAPIAEHAAFVAQLGDVGKISAALTQLTAQPAFQEQFKIIGDGMAERLRLMVETPAFKSMVDSVKFPRAEWGSVLDGVREHLEDDEFESVVTGMETAAVAEEGAAKDSVPWLLRWLLSQTPSVRYAVAHGALGVLCTANVLVVEAALDEPLPADLKNATAFAFALLALVILIVSANEKDD